ncbi:MAG: YjgP/YjgQ family permease [Opitutae bacterium]|nr:YjgP/YjgQ family permease [Opitutae bacterium]
MNQIQRYVFREVFAGTFLTLLILVFILTAGNAMRDKLLQFMEGQFSLQFIVELFSLLLPYAVKFALPPALLTGILLGLGRLSADSEITAMRASGFGLLKIAMPIFGLSLILAGICFYINSWAAPKARTDYKEKLARTAMENPLFFFQPGTFVTDFPGYILYVGNFDGKNLHDFWVWSTIGKDEEPDAQGRILQAMRFEKGTIPPDLDTNTLILEPQNLQIEINDEDDPENFQGNYRPGMAGNTILRFSLDKRGKDLKINRKPSMLSLEELIKRRDRLANVKNITEAEKKQLLETQMQLHSNASMACSVIAFAAIGIPLAIRTARRETMANAALALGLALGYYVLSILLGLLKDHPSLRPDLLAWLPNLLFLSCGLLFLRKVR